MTVWRPPPMSYVAVQIHQQRFQELCDRYDVPDILRKFPLSKEQETNREKDEQECELESQLKLHYAHLIDGIYRHRVLGASRSMLFFVYIENLPFVTVGVGGSRGRASTSAKGQSNFFLAGTSHQHRNYRQLG